MSVPFMTEIQQLLSERLSEACREYFMLTQLTDKLKRHSALQIHRMQCSVMQCSVV